MSMNRRELPILLFNLIYVPAFAVVAVGRGNYEFMLYIAVILAVGGLVYWKQSSVQFSRGILWGLSGWGLLHMCGGLLRVGNGVLYELQLIPGLVRFDQLVHAVGFGVATLVCHHLLKNYLRPGIMNWKTLAVLVVLMGSGVGAMNEIIEFIAVKTMPETGVGGYDNTMGDLIFNLIGGTIAVTILRVQGKFP